MAQRLIAFLVDTDIFIDYLNGIKRMREILDSPSYRVYYSTVTRKELLAKPGLSTTERRRIRMLLSYHRQIAVDAHIAERFSSLLAKYTAHGLRRATRWWLRRRGRAGFHYLTETPDIIALSLKSPCWGLRHFNYSSRRVLTLRRRLMSVSGLLPRKSASVLMVCGGRPTFLPREFVVVTTL